LDGLKITGIETIPVRVPIREQLAIRGKGGYHSTSPFLLVKVHTDSALTGLGEVSCTPRWSGEDQFTAAHFIGSIFEPLLMGKDALDLGANTETIRSALFGHPFTKAALEMAFWDLLGKAAGVPVYRLLGGKRRDFVPLKWSISGVAPDKAAGIAKWAVDQGFRTMKVKVGIDPEQDVQRVRAVRQAVGPDVRLGIDANGAWKPRTAIEMARRLAEYGIYFVEQPVPPGDVAWMAEVRDSIQVPVIADESLYSAQDGLSLIRAGAADVFSVYVGKAGGIAAGSALSALADAAGLSSTLGSNLEMGIGSAAMLHLAIATPAMVGGEFPCDIIGPLFYEDELLQEPLDIRGGEGRVPERPGLGVELDEDKVNRYRVDASPK
jgi:L-alanine-DL-glutamate epimerase-like enolase superfamily enzyme